MSIWSNQIRTNGYRRARVDGKLKDLGDDLKLNEEKDYAIDAIVDSFVVQPGIEKQIVASLEHGLELGDGMLSFHITSKLAKTKKQKFAKGFGCKACSITAGSMHYRNFSFNDPTGACETCGGIGTAMRVYPPLLVPDVTRTLNEGAFIKEAMNCDKNSWGGRMLCTLSTKYKFSLDVPYEKLPKKAIDILLYGTKGKEIPVVIPKGAKQGTQHAGKMIKFPGLVNQIEHRYRWYRKQGSSNDWTDSYLKKVMVEYACPECDGARLKRTRRLVTVGGANLHTVGEMHLVELQKFLKKVKSGAKHKEVTNIIRREVNSRLELLIAIGLDYLNLNRRSGTLSGGEAQRIRLSTQIGSGLMGMLYVLDEPSIGLHPKDNVKMIETMRRLRDLGNTVIVVEHDEETIRAADYIVEIGPGPGVHGGEIVEQGTIKQIVASKYSVTGQFLSGKRKIEVPKRRRPPGTNWLTVTGARHNNLQDVTAKIPLGQFVCVTGSFRIRKKFTHS